MLTASEKQKIRLAIQAGRDPIRGKNGNFLLRFGQGFKFLIKNSEPTDAGRYWAEQSGRTLPSEGFDPNQQVVRRGRAEYITLLDGTERLVRSYDAARQRYAYSRLGNTFFKEQTSEWLASVPATIHGKRLDKSTYQVKTMLPVESLGIGKIQLNQNLSNEEKVARIKSEVLKNFSDHQYTQGKLILYEYSDEQALYDRDREWTLSELRTNENSGDTKAILNRPLAKRPKIYPCVACPLDLLNTALEWHDDIYCVPRQLGELLHQDWACIADEFEHLAPGWRDRGGITANEILKYAEVHNYTCIVWWQSRCIEKRQGEKRAICLSVEGSHAYIYRGYRKLLEKIGPVRATRLKRQPKPRQEVTEEFSEVKEGCLYHHELQELRVQLLKQGLPVQCTLIQPHDLKSLKIPIEKGVFCTITRTPPDHSELKDFVARLAELTGLPLTYRGEGLPNLTLRMLQTLIKEKRRYLTPQEKKELLLKQNGRCNSCLEILGDIQCDHVVPLCECTEQVFQILCPDCHTAKTWAQSAHSDILASSFNTETHRLFCESPRPKAMVFEGNEVTSDQNLLLDIRRCRSNALRQSPFDFPVFSVLDEIVPAEQRLYDFAYLTKRAPKTPQSLLQSFYQGPGWYPRPMQEAFLHFRICTWQNFKWGFDASGHLDKNMFREPIDRITEAWGDHENGKRGINSAIGLMHIENDYCYSMRTSTEECDELMGQYYCKTKVTGLSLWDYIYRTKLHGGGTSYRALHDWIMGIEHQRLMIAYHQIRNLVPAKNIFQCCTDSILFSPAKSKRKRCLELNNLTYSQLHEPKRLCMGLTSSNSDEHPFRVEEIDKRLKGKYRIPVRDSFEIGVQDIEWKEVDALETIKTGKSLMIQGIAGVGKSYLARECIELIKSQGKTVKIISKTHVAALNLGGQTANHFGYKIQNGSPNFDYVVIDEVSQLELNLWTLVQRLSFLGTKYILLGDWNQFGVIGGNTHCGNILPKDCVERSKFLRILAEGNRTTLTQNRRSDQALFDFYSSLISGGSMFEEPLENILAWARQRFPKTDRIPDVCLTISHKHRQALNRYYNKLQRPEEANLVQTLDGPLWLHVGLKLVGHMQERKCGCVNGGTYVVKAFNETVLLECQITKREFEVNIEFLKKSLRLAYAQTQAGCQGETKQGVVRVFSNHPRFSKTHLFVCASRATSSELLEIV